MHSPPVITFTDFGGSPYIGQLDIAIMRCSPDLNVIHLVTDAPEGDPRCSAFLLAALVNEVSLPAVYLCVVDPEVGGNRLPIAVRANGSWFVGPDNGLLSVVIKRYSDSSVFELSEDSRSLSQTFHGRDLFAPLAATLSLGKLPSMKPLNGEFVGISWKDDLFEVIYVDRFGNLFTGIRASQVSTDSVIGIKGQQFNHAPRFEAVPAGELFWYENSCGLVEIAANRARAVDLLGVTVGCRVFLD